MDTFSPTHKASFSPPAAALAALEKFYTLVDDPAAVQRLGRRLFFEFLRTRPTLTVEEVDDLWALADLLGDVCAAWRPPAPTPA